MALTPIAVPTIPNVPKSKGVPPLKGFASAINVANLLSADVLILLKAFQGPRWGIFTTDGEPAFIGSSVVEVAAKSGNRVANFPIEDGQFAAYNKAKMPFDALVTLTVAGTETYRGLFMDDLKQAADSLDLFNVVMPEFVLFNCTIVLAAFERRSRNGVAMITVDIGLQEVRPAAAAKFTQPKEAQSASPVSGGAVQTSKPTAQQADAALGDLY